MKSIRLGDGEDVVRGHVKDATPKISETSQIPVSVRSLHPETNIFVSRLLRLINLITRKLDVLKKGTKFEMWKEYHVRILGADKETTKELYKRHVALYYVTVLLVGRVLAGEVARTDILNGNVFRSRGILNFIEEDNWFDVLSEKDDVLDVLDDELRQPEFIASINEDLFRLLYEALMSPRERHDLGEFYTPPWLARILVNDVITKDNVVLDPACGSGIFLTLALERKIELGCEHPENQVIGFDINPIAVIIARASYLLALKARGMKRYPSIIPVFLADSLMATWHPQVPSDDEANIPDKKVQAWRTIVDFSNLGIKDMHAQFFYPDLQWDVRELHDYIDKMKVEVARIERAMREDGTSKEIIVSSDFRRNKNLLLALVKLRRQGKGGEWFYLLKNITVPYQYLKKVDVVIGNPPWLTYKELSSNQQAFLDELYVHHVMKSGPQNKANQDLAGFFIVRCSEFLKNDDEGRKIAFILTRAIFDGAQYHGLRIGTWRYPSLEKEGFSLRMTSITDIARDVNPFRRSSCIIILKTIRSTKNHSGEHGHGAAGNMQQFPIKIDGRIIYKSSEDNQDSPSFKIRETPFYINKIGDSSSISAIPFYSKAKPSPYKKLFKRGASFIPRPYYLVRVTQRNLHGSVVTTVQRTRLKGKYKASWRNETIPTILIYPVILGENIKKFTYTLEYHVVVPIIHDEFIFVEEADERGYHYTLKENLSIPCRNDSERRVILRMLASYCEKFNEFEKDWEAHRRKNEKFITSRLKKEEANLQGDVSRSNQKSRSKHADVRMMSLFRRLNKNNLLLSQRPYEQDCMVVYNAEGNAIRAAVVEERRILVDDSVVYYPTESREEAHYLAAILNSRTLLDSLKQLGILAERHVKKKPLDLPIPMFLGQQSLHFRKSSEITATQLLLGANGVVADEEDHWLTERALDEIWSTQRELARLGWICTKKTRKGETYAQELNEIEEHVKLLLDYCLKNS